MGWSCNAAIDQALASGQLAQSTLYKSYSVVAGVIPSCYGSLLASGYDPYFYLEVFILRPQARGPLCVPSERFDTNRKGSPSICKVFRGH